MGARSSESETLAPRLETDRLVLRAPEPRDAGDVFETHRHRSAAEGVISVPHPCPPDHGETWIRSVRAAMTRSELRVWVLECRESGRVIGDCGLDRTREHRRGSLGYILHPDRQGAGLMTEALSRMLRHAFIESVPRLERIEADIYPGNDASFRLVERLGFRREGVLRGYIHREGEQRDAVRVSLLRPEFRSMG